MLTVNHFEMIRRKVILDGHSQRAVAQELGHSRKTVAKALAYPIPPGYQMVQARSHPVMDPHRAVVEQWLQADGTAPVKQRHTGATDFHERLRDEHQLHWVMRGNGAAFRGLQLQGSATQGGLHAVGSRAR